MQMSRAWNILGTHHGLEYEIESRLEDVIRAGRQEFHSQMSRCARDYLSGYSEFYRGELPVFPSRDVFESIRDSDAAS